MRICRGSKPAWPENSARGNVAVAQAAQPAVSRVANPRAIVRKGSRVVGRGFHRLTNLFRGGRPSPQGVPATAGSATEGMRVGPGRTRNRLKPGLRAYSAKGTLNTYRLAVGETADNGV